MQNASEWLQSFKATREKSSFSTFQTKAKTISVTGGKGGVGKTTVAIKLAKELAKQGNKVLLIDCDYNLSNTSIKLGIPLNNQFYNLISSQKSFDECLFKQGNFHLLPSCNGSMDLFANNQLDVEQFIVDIITTHENEYDYIMLDCPAGLQKNILKLNAYCEHRLMVVTPDRSSITDAYSLIKVLKNHFGVNLNHLIVNKVNDKKQFLKVVNTLSETTENFLGVRTSILGAIMRNTDFSKDFDDLILKGENSDLQKNFMKVLENLTEKLGAPSMLNRTSDAGLNVQQEVI